MNSDKSQNLIVADYENQTDRLNQKILEYPLVELIARDTDLKKTGENQWVGKSPLRQDKNPSFSVGLNNGTWCYYDFGTTEGGNIYTYLKEKHGITGVFNIAEFLGISTDNTDKIYTTNYQKTWTAAPAKKTDDTAELIEYHTEKIKQLSLFDLIPVRENTASLDELENKTEWLYNEPVAAEEKIIKKNGKTKKAKLSIFAQRVKDDKDGNKKWRYIQKEKRIGGFTEEHLCYKLDLAKNGTDVCISTEVTTSDVPFYLGELVQNSNYLLDCEGESDTDIAALYLGLNAICEKKSLSHYEKQLPKLLKDKENIKLIIIFADNDYAGLSYAKKKLKAYKEHGLGCLVINSYTKKIITKFEPDIDLQNYFKDENGKHSNDSKGYDFKDLILSFVNSGLSISEVIGELNTIIKNAINELLVVPKKESETTDYQDFYDDDTVTVYHDDDGLNPDDDDDFADIWTDESSAPSEPSESIEPSEPIEPIKTDLNIKDIINLYWSKVARENYLNSTEKITIHLTKDDLRESNKLLINTVIKNFIDNNKNFIVYLDGIGAIAENNKIPQKYFIAFNNINNYFKFTPNIKLSEKYLSADILLNAIGKDNFLGKVIGVKSGLGTNKTGSTLDLINNPIFNDLGCLGLSDINRLLLQFVARASGGKRYFYHLQTQLDDMGKEFFIGENSSNVAACFNSLSLFKDNNNFDNRIVIIDESMSVVQTLLDGGTTRGYADQQFLYQKLRECLKRAALVIVLDGNLTDENVHLVAQIAEKESIKIENTFKRENPHHFNFVSNEDTLKALFLDDIAAGKTVNYSTDNQGQMREIYELILSKKLLKKEQIIIVDKESTEDEAPPEFLSNPDKYLEQNDIKLLLNSPSMGRGFDIQWSGFDSQFGLFDGVLSLDQIEQMPLRIRDTNLERYIFVATKMKANDGKYSKNTYAEKYAAEQLAKYLNIDKEVILKDIINDELAIYGLNSLKFFKEYEKYLSHYLPLFFLMKGHSISFSNAKNHFLDKENIAELKAKKEKEFIEKIERQCANFSADKEYKESLPQIENEIKDINEKLSNSLFLDNDYKEFLESEKAQLSEQKEIAKAAIKENKKLKEKMDKFIPNISSSDRLKNDHILKLTVSEQLKDYYQPLVLLTCLKHGIDNDSDFKKQIYNFTKAARLYGTIWLNGLDKNYLILEQLKKIDILTIIDSLKGKEFLAGELPKYLDTFKVNGIWENELFGEKPKKLITQFARLLECIGYGLKAAQKRKDVFYTIVPLISLDVRDNSGGYPLDADTAEKFYEDICLGIAEKLREKNKYTPKMEKLENITPCQKYSDIVNQHRKDNEMLTKNEGKLQGIVNNKTVSPIKLINNLGLQPTSYLYSLENMNEILQYF